jgi:hypothetical protein
MTNEDKEVQRAIEKLHDIINASKRMQQDFPPEVSQKLNALVEAAEARKPIQRAKMDEIQLLIKRNILDIEVLMNDLREGIINFSDLPLDALINYSSPKITSLPYYYFIRGVKTSLIIWLIKYSDDDYFYQLLTSAEIGNALRKKINAPPADQELTPLLCALICNGHNVENIVKFLLACGADPNLSSKIGHYPLSAAVEYCSFPVIKLLLDAGANPNYNDLCLRKSIVNTAATKNNKELVVALIARGGKFDVFYGLATLQDITCSFLKTYYACNQIKLEDEHWIYGALRCGFDSVLESIFKHMSAEELNNIINQVNNEGITPLDLALTLRKKNLVSLLLAYGADPARCLCDALFLAQHEKDWQDSCYEKIKQAYHKDIT